MADRITWPAPAELAELLRRYYRGEAEQWPAIQALVHAELRERGLPVGPRHISFRRGDAGYTVIVEGADDHTNL
jgi:hypothetical protein